MRLPIRAACLGLSALLWSCGGGGGSASSPSTGTPAGGDGGDAAAGGNDGQVSAPLACGQKDAPLCEGCTPDAANEGKKVGRTVKNFALKTPENTARWLYESCNLDKKVVWLILATGW